MLRTDLDAKLSQFRSGNPNILFYIEKNTNQNVVIVELSAQFSQILSSNSTKKKGLLKKRT